MSKQIIAILLLFFCLVLPIFGQDSLYFFRSGGILHREAVKNIDSLVFLPPNHYTQQRSSEILEKLISKPELSLFTLLLLQCGYEDFLSDKTIWAPSNQAIGQALISDSNFFDPVHVRRLVEHHLSKGRYLSGSQPLGESRLQLFSQKKVTVSNGGDGISIEGIHPMESNIRVADAAIHVLNKCIPYQNSIWEHICETTSLDTLRSYLESFSAIDAADEYGFDALAPSTNIFSREVAAIANNDSAYTMLLPSNQACHDAYQRLLPLCKATTAKTQDLNTKWYVLRELIFAGKRNLPLTDSVLYSGSGRLYRNPNNLFAASSGTVSLSNGQGYPVNTLVNFDATVWNREVRIEAENSSLLHSIYNYTSSVESSLGAPFKLSDDRYLKLTSTTNSSLQILSANFYLPNLLAGSYDIYVVFVPTVISDTTDKRPYKVDIYQSSTMNSAFPTYTKIGVTNTTSPTQVTKLLVASKYALANANLQFKRSYVSGSTDSPINGIRIRNMAGTNATELKNYNRNLRIDCILLVPVE